MIDTVDPLEKRVAPVTLVMTVLNEAMTIRGFLASVEMQSTLPTEFVIVDGGSSDDTVGIISAWSSASSIAVRLIVEPNASIARGRNLAIKNASQPIVAIADGGTRLDRDWLARLVTAITPDIDIASGFFKPSGDTFKQRLIGAVITPLLQEIDGEKFLPSSRSLALRRSAWAAVDGYPEWLDYCEDLVFDLDLKTSGYKFAFVPTAIVSWGARSSVGAFSKQYYRYARGDGKAGLWPKRHAARYATYLLLLLGFNRRIRAVSVLTLLGVYVPYQLKFLRRVWRRRELFANGRALPLALAPAIVVIGDVSKMAGYPVGLRWRIGQRTDHGRGAQ